MAKSPNAKTSMKLIKTAIEAVRTAREDLKNDEKVRDLGLSTDLEFVQANLALIEKRLKEETDYE
jgi:hypothetical protein